MMRPIVVAATLLCLAGSAFADEAVISAVKARIEKCTMLDAAQKAALTKRAEVKLAAPNLGTDRRNHAARMADRLVAGMFEQPMVLTTAERFPIAADYFGLALARFSCMKPYSDDERETTAANWNAAAKGADAVIDSTMDELPAGLRAKVKEAAGAKLKKAPKDFGVYFGLGVWSGDALSAQAAAKEVADDPFVTASVRSYVASMKTMLSNSNTSTELAASAEATVVSTMSGLVTSQFETLLGQRHLDSAERLMTAVEPPKGLEEQWQKVQQEAAQEAQKRPPAIAPAKPAKQPIKDVGGVPKPATGH
ncbi:MAG: hypothetical protein K2Y05_07750 [Hyphomicrobiaceae bacterium]|nr:hypothetical protein [Burkholderiaceae bacterium]MBX9926236.1 hypothetical protein [Hyphomicrobiaceae bacterium]